MPQRKNKAILIRTKEETNLKQNFKKFISENKLSTHAEGLECLLAAAGSEVFQEYEDCQFFSEYPPDSKHFIQCSYGKSGKRPRKREHCQACAHNREIKVLMQSRGKIEQQNSELQRKVSEAQHRLGDLNADIVKKTRETEKITSLITMPEQLKKKEKEIADLRRHYEDALRAEQDKNTKQLQEKENELKEEKDKTDYLTEAYDELQRQFAPKSVLEVEKRLSEEKQPITASRFPQKPMENSVATLPKVETAKPTQTIQRVTEREKTVKEKVVETVISEPFTNQEIECPLKGNQYVDIIKECKRSCREISVCHLFPEISKGTMPLDAKIRPRQG